MREACAAGAASLFPCLYSYKGCGGSAGGHLCPQCWDRMSLQDWQNVPAGSTPTAREVRPRKCILAAPFDYALKLNEGNFANPRSTVFSQTPSSLASVLIFELH